MPTYEYECKSCAYTFEAFQSMHDEPLKKCPQCGRSVRRLIRGGAGVIFKGSGFYITDKNKSSESPKPHKTSVTPSADNSASSASAGSAGKAAAATETPASKDKPASTEKEKSAPESSSKKSDN